MGSNSISTVSSGQIPTQDKWNQYKSALCGDLLPRNANGAVEDGAGSLGSSSAKFDTAYIKTLDAESLGTNNNGVSESSGAFTTTSSSYVDVTNLSITFLTTGRPVVIMLIPDGTAMSYIGPSASTGTDHGCAYNIMRDSTQIYETKVQKYGTADRSDLIPPGAIFHFDPVAEGEYTYKIQAKKLTTYAVCNVQYCKLVVYEV